MPSTSPAQQRLFGMVHAYQQGKLKKAPKKVKDMAETIDPQDVTDFAATPHGEMPEKKAGLNTSVPGETVPQLVARLKAGEINMNTFFTNALSHKWSLPVPGIPDTKVKQVLESARQDPEPYIRSLQKVPDWMIRSVINKNPGAFNSVQNAMPATTKVAAALLRVL